LKGIAKALPHSSRSYRSPLNRRRVETRSTDSGVKSKPDQIAPPNYLLGIRTLSQADLKDTFRFEVNGVEPAQNVVLAAVTEFIIALEKRLVISFATPHLMISARVSVPEIANGLLGRSF
jgi:hypothetical protein